MHCSGCDEPHIHAGAVPACAGIGLFFDTFGDTVCQAAQAFLPPRIGRPASGWRLARALFLCGLLIACINASCGTLLVQCGQRLFTDSAAVSACIATALPLFALQMALHCCSMSTEGILLATRESAFLCVSYVFIFGVTRVRHMRLFNDIRVHCWTAIRLQLCRRLAAATHVHLNLQYALQTLMCVCYAPHRQPLSCFDFCLWACKCGIFNMHWKAQVVLHVTLARGLGLVGCWSAAIAFQAVRLVTNGWRLLRSASVLSSTQCLPDAIQDLEHAVGDYHVTHRPTDHSLAVDAKPAA